ncbi:MAG TPA: hypothetical protein PKN24_16405 [bacterium]|nr:hypothetical protein [bacterium]
MKTKWQKPELVILYRASSDENLLGRAYCKHTVPKNLPDNAVASICAFDQGSRAGTPCNVYILS